VSAGARPVRVAAVTGRAIEERLADVAALRLTVFREFPYLYLGDAAYERRYLAAYAAAEAGLVVLALAADAPAGAPAAERVVGASTALPLVHHEPQLAAALAAAGVRPADVYYFAESVLEPAYRGRGLGRAFFAAREAHARALGFRVGAFCAVDRPADHPRRPPGYRDHSTLWTAAGFVRRPDIRTTIAWRDLDEIEESPKPMTFWLKELA
jgi:GNAT superfamily N-acetyltransferase